ncbi:Glutathione S-transferase domain-containing protein [Acidithiobacillus ferrivorans]|uniref:Glutathione S-transferase n=1 Tax=Acidithiobacillus ferrivorans TaxID=160808 RepID=A0A060UVG2_9PROT|nr:glutathione S-transferase family protein [Acidithiobacillus ferrivorans]MBN6740686.1 glutathione S-transferase family protein [Acidithiobacillus sp. MC6.1]OCB02682.1 glutathione S-transferase [Acidithiobacillus ferrivorans]QQD73196.1 glutathione S-transferase family protein [Acidithiobacillus ferrivorans]CDQ10773.1 Glutathione S-transferase domain-containing protein [Acidithiobacillus ferrivorans]SMH65914.1 Glutathione S-transferase domain-containing protein [Acidithiobacillus ferrivorans]
MALELISFPLCPYVQRSIITLLHKQVGFTLTHIDLAHKPEWFLALSPMGKVPCLKIDEHTVLFESQVINEYLDETIAPALHPADPLERAQHRAWIAFGSEILNDQLQMMIAQGEERFAASSRQLFDKLERLDKIMGDGPFFANDHFSLVDAALAPLFMRMEILHALRPLPRWESLGKLRRLTASLMELPEVAGSVTADFPDCLRNYISEKGSLFLRSA